MKIKIAAIVASVILVITGTVLVINNTSSQPCINVYVDYGILDNNNKTTECIASDLEMGALDVLRSANIDVIGTEKYGNQIVCRVNNLPEPSKPIGIKDHEDYIETCKDMPAEFAYWAVLIKKASPLPDKLNAFGGWGWAQTGIADVKLKPGDSIGLVFAQNENVKFPE